VSGDPPLVMVPPVNAVPPVLVVPPLLPVALPEPPLVGSVVASVVGVPVVGVSVVGVPVASLELEPAVPVVVSVSADGLSEQAVALTHSSKQ